MLLKTQLEDINDKMLKRNEVSNSVVGYKYSDKQVCKLYNKGLTNEQAYKLSKILKKYAKNQLDVTEQILAQSESYYCSLINTDNRSHVRPFINIRMFIDEDYSYVSFKYNKEFISILKDYNAKWMENDFAWKVRKSQLHSILYDLENAGGDIDSAKESIGNNIKECFRLKTEMVC